MFLVRIFHFLLDQKRRKDIQSHDCFKNGCVSNKVFAKKARFLTMYIISGYSKYNERNGTKTFKRDLKGKKDIFM
jgi:hypothetical protein